MSSDFPYAPSQPDVLASAGFQLCYPYSHYDRFCVPWTAFRQTMSRPRAIWNGSDFGIASPRRLKSGRYGHVKPAFDAPTPAPAADGSTPRAGITETSKRMASVHEYGSKARDLSPSYQTRNSKSTQAGSEIELPEIFFPVYFRYQKIYQWARSVIHKFRSFTGANSLPWPIQIASKAISSITAQLQWSKNESLRQRLLQTPRFG
ncbi:hypothetical protein PARPLA_01231 [Rhodobacteraceae bacterium THAF1]|nr:hypothetical protein FIU81_01025 [Palleronia sp. THAF1]VDC20840.1 hypothetical protein PARPLA_01231 [Rhodobacteraceae bacterium THAF1]